MENLEQIKEKVLVDNNAQSIYQHIIDLENDLPKHGRRWFWELLQNAKDAVTKESVEIKTEYLNKRLFFGHTGKEFSKEEIIHLIYHGSTKREDVTKTGKFGTGFMTTHLLSKKVNIKGKLANSQNYFDFILDRSGDSVNDLKESLENSWQNFKDNSNINPNSNNRYNTQFIYQISNSRENILDSVLSNLNQSLPFVLSMNHEISKINIINNKNNFITLKQEECQINDKIQSVKIKIDTKDITIIKIEEEKDINFTYQRDDQKKVANESVNFSICIELEDNCIKKIDDSIPRFFYDFPLFTTEAFQFPIIINSLSFAPKKERDGIYLGNIDTYDVEKNKAILSQAFKSYILLIDHLIENEYFNTHYLADFQKINIPELDNDWINSELRILISNLLNKTIIRNDDDKLMPFSEAIIPVVAQTDYNSDFWDLVKTIYPKRIVLKKLHQDWICIINKINEFDLSTKFFTTLNDISKIISIESKIDNFALKYFNNNQIDAFKWLNNFYKQLNDNNYNNLLEEFAIIPNQNGTFVKKTSYLKLDKEIDERLKDILSLLDEDIRSILINSHIIYFNKKNAFSNKTQQEVYEHTIDKIKSIDECFTDNEFEASKNMLDWMLKNNKIEKLDGFPISTNSLEDKKKIHKLSETNRLLAPIKSWGSSFGKYSDIFNSDFILNNEYEVIIKNYINILEDRGYIYSKPLYYDNHTFNKDDLKKIISEKVDENFWVLNDDDDDSFIIPELRVSKIAYFVYPPEKNVLKNSRKSKKQTQNLLEFIFNCILINDEIIFQEQIIEINSQKITIYPSYWLAKLKSNQWVNIGKDKDEAPTSNNLSSYFEKSEQLQLRLKDVNVAKLLNIIGVSVGDLTKNIYAKTDKEKLEWDKAYTSILSAGHNSNINPEEIQNIFDDEKMIEEIKRKYNEKNIVKANREIGITVEEIFKEIIDEELENLNLKITKVVVGRDFDIEYDFIQNDYEELITVEKDNIKYSIELKSTRTNYIMMTKAQGIYSAEASDNFSLCVLQHNFSIDDFKDDSGNINQTQKDTIKSSIRFVPNIGEKLIEQVLQVTELEEKVEETRSKSDEIEVDIENNIIKYKVNNNVWENSLSLESFIDFIKMKFE